MSWVSLQDFADAREQPDHGRPRWAHGPAAPARLLEDAALRSSLEEGLSTLVQLQRAEWLESGVVLGPRAWPEAHSDLVEACTRLGVTPQTAIVGPCALKDQHTIGTTDRALLRVSSWFLKGSTPAERRFLFGRLSGHVRCDQVTWSTLHAALSEGTGLRALARRAVGPLADLLLTPVSMATRLSLARWHRGAELNADRAGLIACADPEGARRALLREALGVHAEIDVADYIARTTAEERRTAGRWAELWADRPWLHRRLQALDLFERSDAWAEASGRMVGDPLDDAALADQTDALLEVS